MPLVGTAGHVDHGKSTLVKRLTGRETDRWAEEQERGLTIDLGFAWADLGDGIEVSFVDVPGHDRFIKNMLAGVDAVDVALFVVAADEGWMPQSEEHLAVLHLLGVDNGVVALTKVDRVDTDLVELATLEIEEHLEGSTLEGSPIVPVSAHTGSGVEAVVAALRSALGAVPARPERDPRLWIDRSFSIPGAGTVVTGTLVDGRISTGDSMTLYPSGAQVRVRGIQSHERDLESIGPGFRVASNLSGVDRGEVSRGEMLAAPGRWETTRRFAATLSRARYVDELTNRGAYHLHVGSGSWPVRIRMLSDTATIVDLPEPVPLRMGDRFILRDSGRRLVVGGGRVLDPSPPRPKRLTSDVVSALTAALDASPDERAGVLLDVRSMETLDRLAAHTGGSPSGAMVVAGTAVSTDRAASLSDRLGEVARAFHEENPLRPGLGVAEASDRLGIPAAVLVELVARDPKLSVEGSVVVVEGFSVELTDEQQAALDRVIATLEGAGPLSVPRTAELDIDRELLHAAVRRGELVRVSDEFVYLPSQIEVLTAGIDAFTEPFSVSEFKDEVGLSRKYAVPFLEWADDQGLTVRMGDKRRRRE